MACLNEPFTSVSVWISRNAMIKKHPLFFFLLFAFPLSWYPWIIALIQGRQSGPNPLGPLVAAILVSALSGGWTATKTLLARIVRWRVNIFWYAVVLMLPVLTVLAAATINVWVTGASISNHPTLPGWREIADRFIFIFLFIGLGEETGWRGFALEHLQKNRTAVQSSWILMPIWAIWHLPLFGSEIVVAHLIPFLIGVGSATFLSTWIYNRTNGSVLLPMLFHTTVNTVGAGLVFPMFQGAGLVSLWWIYAGIWAILAASIVLTTGIERRLSASKNLFQQTAGAPLIVN